MSYRSFVLCAASLVFSFRFCGIVGAPLNFPAAASVDYLLSEERLKNVLRSVIVHLKNLLTRQLKTLPAAYLLSEETEFDILPERNVRCSRKKIRQRKTIYTAFRHMDGSKKHVERGLFDFKRPNLGVPSPFGSCSAKWICFDDPARYPAQRVQANMTTSDENTPCYCQGLENGEKVIPYFCQAYHLLVPVLSSGSKCPGSQGETTERRFTMEKTRVGFSCSASTLVWSGPTRWDNCPNKPTDIVKKFT